MQKKQFIVLVAICIGFVTVSLGQHKRYAIKNGIGILGGITQFDIATDNFVTKSGSGFIGGLTATVDIPHKWYTVSYGMQLSENSIEISGRQTAGIATEEMLEYKLMTVQVAFLFHAKILKDNLTIDFGPQLQYNGELELKDDKQKEYFVNGYDALLAEDISTISQFNANGVIGASAGIGNFKLRAMYSYGFTNILNKLNSQDITTTPSSKKFKGNQNMLAFALMITF
ncbi:outer membrane beta-barrel protein [Ichthyenterobacterium magnum]|nr:outer membrane beta-barrel protein [Ichthyenterobacterium magnum]